MCNAVWGLWERSCEKSRVSEWYKQIKSGHEHVEDDERNGYPRSHKVRNLWIQINVQVSEYGRATKFSQIEQLHT
jgi:hypothetical protein